jgi:transposase
LFGTHDALLVRVEGVTASCETSLREENIRLRREAHRLQERHRRDVSKMRRLQGMVQALKEKVAELTRRLFGRRSEKFSPEQPKEGQKSGSDQPKRRGQAKGRPGHGRKARPDLPRETQLVKWPGEEPCCAQCGLPYSHDGTADSYEEIVWEVRVFKRVIRRQRYRQGCSCPKPGLPVRVSAPAPARLIPRGLLSLESIVESLLRKFDLWMPMERTIREWTELGVPISAGTWCGVWQRLVPLFTVLAQGIHSAAQAESQFLMDETRWEVFVEMEGKESHRWWLWVVVTPKAKIYILAPTRGADVPKEFFDYKPGSCLVDRPFLMADRFPSYKVLADWLILAFCWAHVRRDFLEGQAGATQEQFHWAQEWLEQIAQLYQLNKKRLELGRDLNGTPLPPPFIRMDPVRMARPEYQQAQQALEKAVETMKQRWERELADPKLPARRRKILSSLKEHWTGLTYFVEYPEIPMDNNGSERTARSAVIGRNNFYGSGSIWSGQLMAAMMTILQTARLHGVPLRTYLIDYLRACAENGRQPPGNLEQWLPWNYRSSQQAQGP